MFHVRYFILKTFEVFKSETSEGPSAEPSPTQHASSVEGPPLATPVPGTPGGNAAVEAADSQGQALAALPPQAPPTPMAPPPQGSPLSVAVAPPPQGSPLSIAVAPPPQASPPNIAVAPAPAPEAPPLSQVSAQAKPPPALKSAHSVLNSSNSPTEWKKFERFCCGNTGADEMKRAWMLVSQLLRHMQDTHVIRVACD